MPYQRWCRLYLLKDTLEQQADLESEFGQLRREKTLLRSPERSASSGSWEQVSMPSGTSQGSPSKGSHGAESVSSYTSRGGGTEHGTSGDDPELLDGVERLLTRLSEAA